MDAQRQRRGRRATLGIVLLAAIMTGLTACAINTAGAAGGGAPPPAAQGSIAGKPTPTATPAGVANVTGVTTTGALGTIAGEVVAGPTCPVATVENPCPPKPVPDRKVLLLTPGGVLVTTTMTDANGRFAVRLAPGSYTVHVEAGPGMLGLDQVTPGNVTVHAGQTTTMQIELDTGIR
jgi:hypothetical protein